VDDLPPSRLCRAAGCRCARAARRGAWTDRRSSNPLDGAAPFYTVYRCADARHVAVGPLEPEYYGCLLAMLGLGGDPAPSAQRGARHLPGAPPGGTGAALLGYAVPLPGAAAGAGADTWEVFAESGMPSSEIAAMVERGVLGPAAAASCFSSSH
jgi:hypothetical protein